MTRDYLKGSLVNQAFLTAHLFFFTLSFSGFFLGKQEQSNRVRRDKLDLLGKGKLF